MVNCVGCNIELNGYNTKGAWRNKKPKAVRCGKCYLEFKREKRILTK